MTKQPPLPQTGLLSQRNIPPERKGRSNMPQALEQVPTHLLFQIGANPNTVWTIGHRVRPLMVIGRSDPDSDFTADLDLTPFNALNTGVSRHHLDLSQQGQSLVIQDKGSRNGTMLNDKTLEKNVLYAIQDGDTMVLGGLPITIWFVFAS